MALIALGPVQAPLTDGDAAPKRSAESAADAWVVLSAGMADGRTVPPVVDVDPLPRTGGER
jgi:hypothetical protein